MFLNIYFFVREWWVFPKSVTCTAQSNSKKKRFMVTWVTFPFKEVERTE